MDEFESYLEKKKIDPQLFKVGEPDKYTAFKALFDVVHPESFTAQKLFLINHIRRRFPLQKKPADL